MRYSFGIETTHPSGLRERQADLGGRDIPPQDL
jgi:hypothetical protein